MSANAEAKKTFCHHTFSGSDWVWHFKSSTTFSMLTQDLPKYWARAPEKMWRQKKGDLSCSDRFWTNPAAEARRLTRQGRTNTLSVFAGPRRRTAARAWRIISSSANTELIGTSLRGRPAARPAVTPARDSDRSLRSPCDSNPACQSEQTRQNAIIAGVNQCTAMAQHFLNSKSVATACLAQLPAIVLDCN